MRKRLIRIGLVSALLLAPVRAQEDPQQPPAPGAEPEAVPVEQEDPQSPADEKTRPADPAEKPENADGDTKRVSGTLQEDEVKVLKPQDVAAELTRLKSKADIKAEVTIVPNHGRKVVVKGVIRNGKLIERFVGRRFLPQNSVEHPRSGVRLWWVDGSAGWIFLRYAQISSIALTGQLTPEERRKIMEALQARRNQDEEERRAAAAAAAGKGSEELEKLSPAELEAYLLRAYPQDEGWNHAKLRELKRKQILEDLPLTREQSIFVKYFPILIKARLKELKRTSKKVEFEPGSENKPAEGDAPGGPADGPDSED